jgi:EAL domain-containing protein (putative c-di-GMP-specific phosphodiesterase class I)/CHASE2 domain-containing sensor protein
MIEGARNSDEAAATGALPRGLRLRHQRERLLAAMSVFLLIALLVAFGALEPAENRLSEVRARLLDRPPTGRVAIVEIDARSVHAINAWPWSRRYHATLIQRLGAAGASMIAFDVDFSANSDPSGDAALGRALSKIRPVILPIFQQRSSALSDEMIKSRPADPFRSAWVGGVNIIPGQDGVVRDFPPATIINGQIQPAMAALLADNSDLGDQTFVPDWSIDVRKIPRFSYIDVIEGRVPARAIAGKRVIVGATAIELGDRYTIPRFGTVPGVVVQALAAESLIQHRALKRSGVLPMLAGLLFVTLLIASGLRPSYGIAAAAVTFASLLVIPVLVQARIPLSVDTAPLLLAGVGGLLLRAVVETRHRIRVAAIHDRETGLPNAQALGFVVEGNQEQVVTVASIQRFEAIRSAIGTAALAEMIIAASERIEHLAAATIHRVAPDTLAWVSASRIDPDGLGNALNELFVEPVRTANGQVDVQWIVGMAGAGHGRAAIEEAMAAVSVARLQGRTSSWFTGAPSSAVRDLSMMGELRHGIDDGQLFVVYQPKLALKTGEIAHAEALVRWNHPTEGMVPPDRFLPLAEETGVVREVTRFVLGRVLADMEADTTPLLHVSVNVSAADISDPGFAAAVIRMVSDSGVDPARLTLEITESAIIRSKDIALATLEAIRGHGFKLSIDDYGTGQSTLSYVKTLPVSELKIDKSFVTSLRENHADRLMVRSTIELAHALGLTVVAEGVEDWDTAKLLSDLGCDFAQGFAIGRGIRIDEFRSLASSAVRTAA